MMVHLEGPSLGQYVHVLPRRVSPLADTKGFGTPRVTCTITPPIHPLTTPSHLSLDQLRGAIDVGRLLSGRRPKKPSVFDDHGFTCSHSRFGFRCKGHGCVACVIHEARRRTWATKASAPTHSFTLTGVGEHHDTVMRNVRRFRRYLDDHHGCSVKVCGSIETTPTGHVHVHGFLYVDGVLDALKIDMDFMAAADRASLGDCRIDRIGHDDWADYAGELAEARADEEVAAAYYGYPMKSLMDDDLRGPFLELNRRGDKHGLGFQSHGFFRDGIDGEHLTERSAKERSYERARGEGRRQGGREWARGGDNELWPMDQDEGDLMAELMFITLAGGAGSSQMLEPAGQSCAPSAQNRLPGGDGEASEPVNRRFRYPPPEQQVEGRRQIHRGHSSKESARDEEDG